MSASRPLPRVPRRYHFGQFSIDPKGFLFRGEAEVVMRPKSLQVLIYLI